jgi:release factor glutamine methyltransferase
MHKSRFNDLFTRDQLFRQLCADELGLTQADFIKGQLNDIGFFEKIRLLYKYSRVTSGYPLQYLTGKSHFYGLQLHVDKNVLIPRPETETLVDLALGIIKESNSSSYSIIDIGTGSGCIIIALYKQLEKTLEKELFSKIAFSACDISVKALKIAKMNAKNNQAKIRFFSSDLLSRARNGEQFDLVLANLPYLKSDYQKDNKNLSHEPRLALDGLGEDGLQIIERLITQLNSDRYNKTTLILELDPDQVKKAVILLNSTNYNCTIKRDLCDRERFIVAKRSN